jgi:hypothetical protein
VKQSSSISKQERGISGESTSLDSKKSQRHHQKQQEDEPLERITNSLIPSPSKAVTSTSTTVKASSLPPRLRVKLFANSGLPPAINGESILFSILFFQYFFQYFLFNFATFLMNAFF